MEDTLENQTVESIITTARRAFCVINEEGPLLLVLDIGSASKLAEELGLSEVDELSSYSGMDIAFTMNTDGQTVKFY
tara:strand:- start:27786 stop:28016 length:231 start_codon:yes stop_codon:yes gene_type:complete